MPDDLRPDVRAGIAALVDVYQHTGGDGPEWDAPADVTVAVLGTAHARCQRAVSAERNARTPSRRDAAWLRRQLNGLKKGSA